MFVHEFALLAVIVLPVSILVVVNAVLAATGESGTLLLPATGAVGE